MSFSPAPLSRARPSPHAHCTCTSLNYRCASTVAGAPPPSPVAPIRHADSTPLKTHKKKLLALFSTCLHQPRFALPCFFALPPVPSLAPRLCALRFFAVSCLPVIVKIQFHPRARERERERARWRSSWSERRPVHPPQAAGDRPSRFSRRAVDPPLRAAPWSVGPLPCLLSDSGCVSSSIRLKAGGQAHERLAMKAMDRTHRQEGGGIRDGDRATSSVHSGDKGTRGGRHLR